MKPDELVFTSADKAMTRLSRHGAPAIMTLVSQRLRRIDDPGTHAWVWGNREGRWRELVVSRAFGPLGNLEDETFEFDLRNDPLSFHAVLTQFEPDPTPEVTDDGKPDGAVYQRGPNHKPGRGRNFGRGRRSGGVRGWLDDL